jgi:hypothetical protein
VHWKLLTACTFALLFADSRTRPERIGKLDSRKENAGVRAHLQVGVKRQAEGGERERFDGIRKGTKTWRGIAGSIG